MALLEVENLTTQFSTPDGIVRAVNGISYQIDPGETVGIVGESGSGKSISVLSILQLIPTPPGKVTAGAAWFADQDLLQLGPRAIQRVRGRQISMIFQDPLTALNPVLTLETQLTEAMKVHLGLTQAQARNQAIQLFNQVGIPEAQRRIRQYPHQFSGGMRQRVMIAIALACQPQLLIADEPTTALDVTIQAQVVELIKQLRRDQAMAILWITHDLALLAGLADRILVMYAGQIVEQAPVNRLYKSPRHPYTIGLLASLPRLDSPLVSPHERPQLLAIPGNPPDLIDYPQGCPFAPRCAYALEQCFTKLPPLETLESDHKVACWVKPEVNGPEVNG
ncbi:MAG: ABC transporter ATP-binding protein [Oscillatoriales cyanobacterium RM2_1_1]|nr:ABC transporter ATP-binding protein [Oscillatoriales cyanobacterium SM2_3_0]NJO47415.1 ABC transporter ATP-binding protein [Oscillatoriales cyanobacterium RM2_1_1]